MEKRSGQRHGNMYKEKWINDYVKIATQKYKGLATKKLDLPKILEDKFINVAVTTETKKKRNEVYRHCFIQCSKRSCNICGQEMYVNRIYPNVIMCPMKYYISHIVVIGVHSPEEGKRVKAVFYNDFQVVQDKCNKNLQMARMEMKRLWLH